MYFESFFLIWFHIPVEIVQVVIWIRRESVIGCVQYLFDFFSELRIVMARDIRNINRGCCESCKSCSNFISVSGRVLCDYCGCPPAQHQHLPDDVDKKSYKRSASNDDDDRLSSSPDFRASISDGEMGEDGHESAVCRVHDFKSISKLHNSLDSLADDSRGRRVQKSKGWERYCNNIGVP